ncbi:MAG: DUF6596 domain-containing protein [Gemmatimonadaceae bacterium]
MNAVDNALAAFYSGERVAVLATLIKFAHGDFDSAEDALADAIARAVERWPNDGVPERPGAWMLTVARRLLIDEARVEARRNTSSAAAMWGTSTEVVDENTALEQSFDEISGQHFSGDDQSLDVGSTTADDPLDVVHDERLALLYTCCHPSLATSAQLTLALRTIGGLSVKQISRALLEPEATTAQRLVRTKQKIREARVPFSIPSGVALHERNEVVRETLYLVFNQGYTPSEAGALRTDIAAEAIRLARLLTVLMPNSAESLGLLALMLLHHARRSARIGDDGAIVSLEEQDRTRWDRDLIQEGEHLLDRAIALQKSGPYQLQAAIAALHATAKTAAETDWSQIAGLYGALRFYMPTAVVELNAAVALAMVLGPEWGLAQLDTLASERGMSDYHLLPAARADLLRRAERFDEALVAYGEAMRLTESSAEQRYLQRRVNEVSARLQLR